MNKKYKVLITYPLILASSFSKNIDCVTKNWSKMPKKEELITHIKDVDAIISTLAIKLDKDILKHAKKLKIISNFAVGYNNIDIEYCKKNNIIVTNTPDVLSAATAEIAFTLLLIILRRAKEAIDYIKADKYKAWLPNLLLGNSLEGKSIGIIGAGRIGQKFAQYLTGFNTKNYYYNRTRLNIDIEKRLNLTYLSLEDLLKTSDIVSIHVPLTKETNNLINEDMIRLMKNGAYLVNTARGEIIDEDALIKHIDKFAGIGLDVFKNEPNLNKKLKNYDKIVIFPHIGSADRKTRENMTQICYDNVRNVLAGQNAITSVF